MYPSAASLTALTVRISLLHSDHTFLVNHDGKKVLYGLGMSLIMEGNAARQLYTVCRGSCQGHAESLVLHSVYYSMKIKSNAKQRSHICGLACPFDTKFIFIDDGECCPILTCRTHAFEIAHSNPVFPAFRGHPSLHAHSSGL